MLRTTRTGPPYVRMFKHMVMYDFRGMGSFFFVQLHAVSTLYYYSHGLTRSFLCILKLFSKRSNSYLVQNIKTIWCEWNRRNVRSIKAHEKVRKLSRRSIDRNNERSACKYLVGMIVLDKKVFCFRAHRSFMLCYSETSYTKLEGFWH